MLFIGILVIVAIISIVFVLKLGELSDNLRQFTYTSYVSSEYIPDYKKKFGKWPTNLDELPSELESKMKGTQAHYSRERLQLVMDLHKENYKGITILSKDEKTFRYSLLLESGNMKCKSDIESGYCE